MLRQDDCLLIVNLLERSSLQVIRIYHLRLSELYSCIASDRYIGHIKSLQLLQNEESAAQVVDSSCVGRDGRGEIGLREGDRREEMIMRDKGREDQRRTLR